MGDWSDTLNNNTKLGELKDALWQERIRVQSAEARHAALREGMEGLAGELDAEAKAKQRGVWNASRSYAYTDAAARIRGRLEGK